MPEVDRSPFVWCEAGRAPSPLRGLWHQSALWTALVAATGVVLACSRAAGGGCVMPACSSKGGRVMPPAPAQVAAARMSPEVM